MRNGYFPIFAKGRVLKKESLEYLRDFPHDFTSLMYQNYSDGMIFGFSLSYKDGFINIAKGALKYQGDIILVDDGSILVTEFEKILYLKLVIGKCWEGEDSRTRSVNIIIDRNKPSSEGEIELGRFCLNVGAILRCEYDSFSDLRTPENTLDITHVAYAGLNAETLQPRVLKEFAKALLMYSQDPMDTNFAFLCLNTEIIPKNVIQWYIAKKTNDQYKDFTLGALYEKLLELLPEQRRRNTPGSKPTRLVIS